MAAAFDFDVAISGYGPTGQAVASLLARRGHRVVVFERWPKLYGLPRLCTLDGEAARIIQAAGDVDHALRDSHPSRRYVLVDEQHQVLIEFKRDFDHPSGFPFRSSMYQPHIEDAMDAQARASGAEINLGWEVGRVEQDIDGVEISVHRTDAPAQSRTVRAKHVIGADGDRSTVRDALGIEREEWPFHHAWISIDAYRKRTYGDMFSGLSPDLRFPVLVCAPENRTNAFIPIGATRLRFETLTASPDAAHDEDLSEEIGYETLERVWGLTRDDAEIYRQVVYPFKGRLARQFQVGRVFLVGDAAHVMTPFLGQGACAGLRDSISLAWRLDLVLRGLAPESLLESYELERKPHARAQVDASDKLAALACEPAPAAAKRRDEYLLAGGQPPLPPAPSLFDGILHREQPDGDAGIVAPTGTGPVALEVPTTVTLPNGVRFPVGTQGPQGIVRFDGREGRFDDIFGWGFELIVDGVDPLGLLRDAARLMFEHIGGVAVGVTADESDHALVFDVNSTYAEFFAEHACVGVLLRPDFNIFGVIRDVADIPEVVDDLFAQLGARP